MSNYLYSNVAVGTPASFSIRANDVPPRAFIPRMAYKGPTTPARGCVEIGEILIMANGKDYKDSEHLH